MNKKTLIRSLLFASVAFTMAACTGDNGGNPSTNNSTSIAESINSGSTTSEASSAGTTSETSSGAASNSGVASTPVSTPTSLPTSSLDENHELVSKELWIGAYPTQEPFSKTANDVEFDGFTMLAGTSFDTGSKKNISFPAGWAASETAKGTSFDSKGRLKMEGSSSPVPTKKAIKFVTNGPGVLQMAVTSASGSDASRTYQVCDAQGNVIETSKEGVPAGSVGYYEVNYPAAGIYYIYSPVNGINFYYLRTVSVVEKGVENGFTIDSSSARDTFLKGEELSTAGLKVYSTSTNGSKTLLSESDYKVESTYNKDVPGKYTVTVTYKEYAAQSYEVNVCAAKELKVFTNQNGDYRNDVKTTYKVGDQLDYSKMVVKAVLDNAESEELTIPSTSYTVDATAVNMAAEGEYDLKVKFDGLADVVVKITVAGAITQVDNVDTINVAPVTVNGSLVNNVRTFRTVESAMQYLVAIGHNTDVNVKVAAGTYTEKVTISTPKVHMFAADPTNKPVITFNKASGDFDPRGAAYGTQNSYTVGVLEAAVGTTIENIDIYNEFDYHNSKLGDKQAVALYVAADKTTFKNIHMKSFQDTLFAKIGRQYYEGCLIEGAIDFIFGHNAPVLFKTCEVRSLNRNSDSNGGYICATKGVNGANDTPKFGYVFDGCNFTYEEGVTPGTVSIARPWGKESTIAVINSTIAKHVSKTSYEITGQGNRRYETMSGNQATDAHYCEYNNTGEGALTEAVAGMTMLTSEQAAEYTKENIFAATNGQLKFADAWTF